MGAALAVNINDPEYRRMARRMHLKKCPSCSAPVLREGGDNQMTCRCGHRFDWNRATTVVPCDRVHLRQSGCRMWCTTCPGCSNVAKLKLAGVRAGVVVGGPIVATVAGGLAITGVSTVAAIATATAVVPAVVC